MSNGQLSRRRFLAAGVLFAASARADDRPPVRAITRGPKHHWFGYYDKLQFDPAGRYVLGMQVHFEHRSPKADDVVRVGMIDLQDKDRWTELGLSGAWGWQQGCMLQWVPGSKTQVLWNDRGPKGFVCRVLDVKTRESRTVPFPIYTLAPDGKAGIAVDYRRLNDVRPGYGYAGFPDPQAGELTPKDSGVWTVDLATGKSSLLLSIADVAKFGDTPDDAKGAKHWFNHLLFNPSGDRFVFLHRWRPKGVKSSFRTRMLTADRDGKNLHVVDPSGFTSHFIWRDDRHLLAWTKPAGQPEAFYLFEDGVKKVQVVGKGVMTRNGHCTYLPGNEWILNDTYPDRDRLQHVYLYHVKTGKRVPLGSFRSAPEYAGEWRCDTHPRFSPDGTKVVIDSPHAGGRQMYLIDVGEIVRSA
jgi:hypothetical protein